MWRLRAPEVSGWGRVALAGGGGGCGEDWQTRLPRTHISVRRLQGPFASNYVSLGKLLTLAGHLSDWHVEGRAHSVQWCWEEKDSEPGRGVYKLQRAVPCLVPGEMQPSFFFLLSLPLAPNPPVERAPSRVS